MLQHSGVLHRFEQHLQVLLVTLHVCWDIRLKTLCRKEIMSGKVRLLWAGHQLIENTLYFGKRKKSMYTAELQQIEEIFVEEMALDNEIDTI